VAVPFDVTGTASVETVKVLLVPDVQKSPRQVGKRFWDRLKEVPKAKGEGVEISRSENETGLAVAGLPGRGPGARPW
jgi:hypothetical protein